MLKITSFHDLFSGILDDEHCQREKKINKKRKNQPTKKTPPKQSLFLFRGTQLRLSNSFLHKDLFAYSFADVTVQTAGCQHTLLCLHCIGQIFHPALIQADEDRLWHFLLSPSQKQGAASSPVLTELPQLTLLAGASIPLKHERWGSRNGNTWGFSCKVQAQGWCVHGKCEHLSMHQSK